MMSGEVSAHPSLCPPSHGYPPDPDDKAPPPSWVLLDLHAYIADRENATSAYGEMSNGKAIRVTFCTAPPPLVSYICIWCPDMPPTEFEMEPTVEGAEADLVLFRVLSGNSYHHDYFVYKASNAGKGPSLWRLDRAHRYLIYRRSAALLAHRDVDEADDGHYHVAALSQASWRPEDFNLMLYNSMDQKWTSTSISPGNQYVHRTVKVIKLGEGGLMGFVDPWRGIIVCDIFGGKPVHYLPLPQHLIRLDKVVGESLLYRDIAFVEGRLTFVEMHRTTTNPDSSSSWDISTWSISSPWKEQDAWEMVYMINTQAIRLDEDTANVDLLRRPQDNGVMPQPSLGRLYFAHPTLSLGDSHVVYLLSKFKLSDNKALVLSVDMKIPRLQGAALFDAERMIGVTYTQSRISEFFNMSSGKKNVEDGTRKAVSTKRRKIDHKKAKGKKDSAKKVKLQPSPRKIENNSSSDYKDEKAADPTRQESSDGINDESSSDEHANRPAAHPNKIRNGSEKGKSDSGSVEESDVNIGLKTTGSNILFASNLSFKVEHEQVREFFQGVGDILDIRLATHDDGSLKGYAHVEFTSAEAAEKALGFSDRYLMGRPVRLAFAHDYTPNRRRGITSSKEYQRTGRTVYIAGFNQLQLSAEQIRELLKEHFGRCGTITLLSIPVHKSTGAVKGRAYMSFEDHDSISKALEMNGSDLVGFRLYVAINRESSSIVQEKKGESRRMEWTGKKTIFSDDE